MFRYLFGGCLVLVFQAVALGQTASSTSLNASPNPANYGQPVRLTATVTAGATGKVTFYDGVTILGIGTLSSGQAAISTVMLPSGNRKLRAYYQGDGAYAASSSAVVPQKVVATASLGFHPFVSYPGLSLATAIAVGDFDGDGHQDVVIANGSSNSVSVYLGNGDGTFQSGVAYAVGSNPECIAVSDFNGDGHMDIAVANGYSANVSILLGTGDGTFQPALTHTVAGGATDLAAGDFNGDGNADLVVTDGVSSAVTILLGNGDGTFQDGIVQYFAGPLAVAVADWNGDGIADLVLGFTYGAFGTLIGNGDGTFQNVVYGNFMGYEFYSLAAGDFNGDGIQDLFVYPDYTGITGNAGAIFLGKNDGTFSNPLYNYELGSPMGSAVVEDFNGDGTLDIVYTDFASVASVGLFIGNGDGTFQSPVQFPSGTSINTNPYYPREQVLNLAAVGDFNGDGKPDLVVGGNSSSGFNILLGGALPDLTLAVDQESGFTQGQQGAEYFLNVANSGQAATLGAVNVTVSLASSLSASSFSGSGWTCTLATLTCTRSDALAVGSGYPTIILTANVANTATGSVTNTFTVSGGGNLSNATVTDTAFLRLPTTTTLTAAPNPSTLGQPVALTATVTAAATGRAVFYSGTTQLGSATIAAGKSVLTTSLLPEGTQKLQAYYMGDSNYGPSLGTLTQTVAAVPQNGLTPSTVALLSGQPTFLLSGDLNNDGKTDLVAGYTTSSSSTAIAGLLGNGDGTFRAPAASVTVGSVTAAVMGDFNNDGKPDLALLTASGILLLPGNGDGTFGTAQQVAATTGNYLFAADFNRDGNLDLLVATANGASVVFLGNGAGGFLAPLTVIPSGNYQGFAVADMNGDGIPDFIAAGFISNQGVISIFLGSGDGTFQTPINTSDNNGNGLLVADFNGDGKPDVAVSYISVYILLGNGDGTLGAPILANQFAVSGQMIAGDFNGDGKPDIYFPSSNTPSVMFGNGNGTFQSPISLTNVPPYSPIAQGDFNGDGRPDFAVASANSQTIEVFLGGQFPGLSISATHFGKFTSGSTGIYQITVSNLAFAATTAGVTVTDTLPAGLTATSIAGTNWSCTLAPLQCTRTDSLAIGASYPPITLEVAVAPGLGPSVLDNGAGVTYNGIVNSATDATTILPPTTTTLQISPNPATLGQPVTLTATVTAGATGTVLFSDSGISLASAKLVNGQATLITRQIPAGLRYLVATYSGDATHGPSSSAETYQTVQASPTNGFSNASTLATGTGPVAIATGDFRNNGITDLVTANPGTGTVSVLLGHGDGTFGPHTDYPAGINPIAVAVADFNNDGALDIAVADNESPGFVSILLGNGDGTFQPAISVPTGAAILYLVAGDFNGDGKADLAADGSGFILLLGNGDGTFLPELTYLDSDAEAVGDFNRDGKLDVATDWAILLGNGDGTFQVNSDFDYSNHLAAGDLNGDGIPDLIRADETGGVDVLLGNGDGTFKPSVQYGASTYASAILLADVNGDGKLDVVAPGGTVYNIFLGNGDGTLQSPLSYPLSYPAQSAVAGDFNGDGRTDLAFISESGNNITVLLGVLTPVFSITSSHTDPFQIGQTGATYTITAKNDGPGTTSGQVTVTDALPAGLTATAISGTNWNCTLSTLTCTRPDSVGVGASYPPITATISVTATTTGTLTNQVSFSGGGAIPASASDPTTIVGPPITIQTVPSGLQFSVDGGTPQTAPQTTNPTLGPHTIAVAATQAGTPGTQYVFTGWSDNGSASHTITVGTASAAYTAAFQTQFQLSTAPYPQAGGSVTPSSGAYYNAGATVGISAVPNSPLAFIGWSNGATANPLQLTMSAPTSLTADFDIPGATCTMTGDAAASIADVQFIVNEALGIVAANNDLNADGVVNIADVQKVANAVLQFGCIH